MSNFMDARLVFDTDGDNLSTKMNNNTNGINSLTSQLAEKAQQTDLNTTNTNVTANTTAIGSLNQLNTTDKSSLVNALKEIKTQANTNQTQIQSVTSGSPKGTYSSLSALQTAFPTGNTNIYVVTSDGNWYYWNGSAWTAGGTYQSTGIADNSITERMAGFLTKSSNLLNRNTVTSGYLDYTTGNVTASTTDVVSDFIAASPNMYYATYPSGQFAFYDVNKNFISGVTNTLYSTNRKSPSNTAYIRLGLTSANFNSKNANGNWQQQLNVSATTFAVLPPYEDFYIKFGDLTLLTNNLTSDVLTYIFNNITSGVVSPNNTNFLSYSSNLLNRNTTTTGTLDYTTGNITSSTDHVTDFIPVSPNMYIASYPSGNMAFYDTNKNYISGVTNTLYTTNRKTPSNAAYFRFSATDSDYNWQDATTGAKLQINDSPTQFVSLPPYENYGLKFNGEKVLTTSDKNVYIGPQQNIVGVNQETISIGTNANKIDNTASIAIGTNALANLTVDGVGDDGHFNTAIGHNALKSSTTADHNTAVGWSAMADNISGDGNTAVGEDALIHNTAGSSNVAIGNRAMQAGTGNKNVAVGSTAMYYGTGVPTGDGNTSVGYGAGTTDGAGGYNVAIGYWTKTDTGVTNSIAIGNNVLATKSNQAVIGNAQTTENVFHGSLVLYDKTTGNPYFVSINNGQITLTPYS